MRRLADRPWQAAATYPVEPAEYLDMFRPLRRGADLRARVVAVRPETADAVTVVLRPRPVLARRLRAVSGAAPLPIAICWLVFHC